jgi:hypothetical protein
MTVFGAVKNGKVENVVIGESLMLLQALLPGIQLVAETKQSGIAWIGSEVVGSKFKPPQRYESWAFNEDLFVWEAPKPVPQNKKDYYWSEADLDWVVVPILPAPEPDEATKK